MRNSTLRTMAACALLAALLAACAAPTPVDPQNAAGATAPPAARSHCRDEPVIGSNIPKPCGGAASR